MTTAQLKETPIASIHRQAGARMVDFAGWNMPVQYKSIITEHMAVRTKVGLFDVSHMGEFVISGAGAHKLVQYLIANDLKRLHEPDMALYTQFVRPDGGTVDDLIVYRREGDFLLVVNASNIEKDWEWVVQNSGAFADVKLQNVSDELGLLALQGPDACMLMSQLCGEWVAKMPSFTYGNATISGVSVSFGRTGYTGEDGFEIFMKAADTGKVWTSLIDSGAAYGIEPCGLGARDTLRLEAALPLYGHELDESTSPLESGLGWSVKLDKADFSGKATLVKQKSDGLQKQCVCLKADGKALPRQGYPIYSGDEKIGQVSSGSQGVFVGYPIAMGFIPPKYASPGQLLAVGIRDTKVPCTIVSRPFYKRKNRV